jgi:hypothetical protein
MSFILCPKIRVHTISENGYFPPQVSVETPTPLGPLERANLNYWTNGTVTDISSF